MRFFGMLAEVLAIIVSIMSMLTNHWEQATYCTAMAIYLHLMNTEVSQ